MDFLFVPILFFSGVGHHHIRGSLNFITIIFRIFLVKPFSSMFVIPKMNGALAGTANVSAPSANSTTELYMCVTVNVYKRYILIVNISPLDWNGVVTNKLYIVKLVLGNWKSI